MMKTRKQKIFGMAGLALVVASLIGLVSIVDGLRETPSSYSSVEAQIQAGYSTRLFLQPPNDGLTGIRSAETLGYLYGFNGATWDRSRVQSKMTAVSLASGTTETTIWDPAAGKRFRWMGFVLTASAATLLTFKDGTAGTTIFTLTMPIGTPVQVTPEMFQNGYLSTTVDNNLTVTRGTAAVLDGFLVGQEN